MDESLTKRELFLSHELSEARMEIDRHHALILQLRDALLWAHPLTAPALHLKNEKYTGVDEWQHSEVRMLLAREVG